MHGPVKNMVSRLSIFVMVVVMGLFGCGSGLPWTIGGLIVEDALDKGPIDGDDGLDCWDLNANGNCDEEDDATGDGFCDALDCRGADGGQGPAGDPGLPGVQGDPGPPGSMGDPGSQGERGAIIVIVVDDEDDDGPPFGNAYGHNRHDDD